ncbi:TPA: fimbria/pilus periplasmic chaperone [Enterobacter asburiae]|nr:fimbria/pilus periplasmic chaperone [Enterobacter asburiae]
MNISMIKRFFVIALIISGQHSYAAIALDRTRVIVNESDSNTIVNITNRNKSLPFLAQAWVESQGGEKISSPLAVLPPIQRVEAGDDSTIKIMLAPGSEKALPSDRESLFYFNLKEIPPKSSKPNSLQVALQTRVKLFYRPKSIYLDKYNAAKGEWVRMVKLHDSGGSMSIVNDSPYFITISSVMDHNRRALAFNTVMVAPHSEEKTNSMFNTLGANPVLTYVNDYGGGQNIEYVCTNGVCNGHIAE